MPAIFQMNISAVGQNAIVSLIVTGITFSVVFLLNHLNKKSAISNEVSRKVVHMGAGTLYLALYFYNDRDHWSKYLNICPNLLWIGILLWKSQQRASNYQKYDLVVGTMTRTHCGSELLRGPLYFNFVMLLCGTLLYKTVLGAVIMGVLTWGDGLAAVIGVQYGSRRKIHHSKTFDGFLTILIAGMIASIFYTSVLVNFRSVNVIRFAVLSLVAAVTETLSPSNLDNLTIPFSLIVAHSLIA